MGLIIIPNSIYEKTKAHLFKNGNENFAFFLAGIAASPRVSFLVKDAILIEEADFSHEYFSHSMLNLDTLLHITNTARLKGLAVIEAHSHPFSEHEVRFSSIDVKELKEFAAYMLDDLPNFPYAATVWGIESIDGLYWKRGNKRPAPITEIRVVGKNLKHLMTTSAKLTSHRTQNPDNNHSKFSRQVLAIGEEGQKIIGNTKVVVVGAGGLGFQASLQLVYLGVRDIAIIDFDKVEESNLNRLVGATHADVGKAKVEVLKRIIYSINKNINCNALQVDVRDPKALDILKQANVIFSCVDNDGARLILNEISLTYMIPLIDCGVGIEIKEGIITEAGGRVMVIHPDGPCLLCAKEIDTNEASNDLASKEELEHRRKLGYVSGVEVPNPSVVSLNGTISSIAVTEFLTLVTGIRQAKVYTFYDMLEEKAVQRIVEPNPKCYACSLKGEGDKANIERYSCTGTPQDIPNAKD